LKSSRRI